MNLVELVLQQLGGDTLGKLAGALDESQDDVKQAVHAAVPTLLSGLGSLASKPSSADTLWNTLKQVDEDVAINFDDILSGGRQEEVAKKGTSILEALFGKGMVAALIGVLASFLGGKSGLVTKLLPMIAPFVLSMLRRQVQSGNLDLAGLVKMLLGQRGNIASAMPAGLGNRLAAAQGLGDFGSFLNEGKGTVAAASRATTKATQPEKGPMSWLLPLILLAAILGGGYWWLNRNRPAEGPEMRAIEPPAAGAMDAATTFGDVFANLTSTMSSVTDVESAREALPALEKVGEDFGQLQGQLAGLPAESRAALNQTIDESKNAFQEQVDRVLAIPGVGDILRPVLEAIVDRLAAMITG